MTNLWKDKEMGTSGDGLTWSLGEQGKFWISWERKAQSRSAVCTTLLIKTCFIQHKSLSHIKGHQMAKAQFAQLQ